jgi:CubicO group peptidase (beta-lactamase class C family)
MERVSSLQPNFPFRQNFTYSNTNYAAITYVVELLILIQDSIIPEP